VFLGVSTGGFSILRVFLLILGLIFGWTDLQAQSFSSGGLIEESTFNGTESFWPGEEETWEPFGGPNTNDVSFPAKALGRRKKKQPVKASPGDPALNWTPLGVGITETPIATPAQCPLASVPLDKFKHPNLKDFLETHGLDSSNRTLENQAWQRLRQSLVGKPSQKQAAFQYCERVTPNHSWILPPQLSTLDCLFYRIQKMQGYRVTRVEPPLKSKKRGFKVNGLAAFKKLAGAGYQESMNRIHFNSIKAGETFTKWQTTVGLDDCRFINPRIAILREWENFLPASGAYDSMRQIYVNLGNCFSQTHEMFELIHQRMGFLALERRRFPDAVRSLDAALRSTEKTEEHRSLFWRGYLEALRGMEAGKIKQYDNAYWTHLLEKHPLSLHAVVVDSFQHKNSYERLASRPAPLVVRYKGDTWDRANLVQFLFSYLVAKSDTAALESFAKYTFENYEPNDFGSSLYMAHVYAEQNLTRQSIKTLHTALKTHGIDSLDRHVLMLLYPMHFAKEVIKHGKGVDHALMMALMRQESSFNPQATSPAGAKGLMQVMSGTARSLTRKKVNLYDPIANISVGAAFLKKLLKEHDDNLVYTFASYNAGGTVVRKWRKRYQEDIPLLFADLISYTETRHYVNGLLRNMHWYRELLNKSDEEERQSKHWEVQSLMPEPVMFGFQKTSGPLEWVGDR
jgi:soluble lytic murein transglycosylase